MANSLRTARLLFAIIASVVANSAMFASAAEWAYVETASLPAKEAIQAAAADERFVYAIDNTQVAKYDRASGMWLARSTGKAEHLNSGFLWQGKLYAAHSNYPKTPPQNEIKVLDPQSMELTMFKSFGGERGSLTWAVFERDHWWCTFAHYGADNSRTMLVKLDEQWNERGAWTYPAEVVSDLGLYSISGGLWLDGKLLATGHDKRRIYRLKLPQTGSALAGSVLELFDVLPSPFPGQGIAADPSTGGLVGIDRSRRKVVFAGLKRSTQAPNKRGASDE